MATYRIGISSEFSLDAGVGIGTATPGNGLGDLRVEGTYKTEDLDVLGVSTLSRYAGFAVDKINIDTSRDVTLTGEHSTLGDIVVGLTSTFTVSVGATVDIGTVPSVSIGTHFSPPTGGVEERPEVPVEGIVRFNKDLNTLEFYNGVDWRQFTVSGASGRGLFCGGYYPAVGSPYGLKNIEYINIATQGNSHRFGDLVDAQGLMDAASSSTRMVVSGGYNSSFGSGNVEDIQYVTMASEGNAIDFGNQTNATYGTGACSSSTRALIMGGNRMPTSSPYDDGNDGSNVICYIEIATLGDGTDFGDMSRRRAYPASCGDSVRAVIFGGYANEVGAGGINDMETVNYASKGNGVEFGNLAEAGSTKAKSNSVKAIIGGTSGGSSTYTNVIQSLSIQSLGNAVYFGGRSVGEGIGNACSSQTRMVFAGGRTLAAPSTGHKHIDYVEFASEGNSISFGDLGYLAAEAGGSSDSHGGLGGY